MTTQPKWNPRCLRRRGIGEYAGNQLREIRGDGVACVRVRGRAKEAELDTFESPPNSLTALEPPPKPKPKIPDPEIDFSQDELNYIQNSGFPTPNEAFKRILEDKFDVDRLQNDVNEKIMRGNHVKAGLSKNKEKNKDKIDDIVRQVDTLKKYIDRINLLAGGEKILVTQKASDPSTGAVVYERQGDRGIVDLLTKRYNPKRQYSSKAIQIFKDLSKLANIPTHKSSGKSKLTGGAIFSDFKDLKDSWYNVSSSYNNNKLKYSHDSGTTWHEIEFPDGNFSYEELSAYIQRELVGSKHSETGITLTFVSALFKVLVSLEDGFQVDLQNGDFADLIGFTKKIVTATSYGEKISDITRSVDDIDVHTSIISDSVVGANNTYQKKDGYRFTVDTSTASETVADWHNAYFEMDFKLTKMDNTIYGAADAAAIINGGFSLIQEIKVNFESVRVLGLSNANHAANVKNLTEFSEEHSRKVGPRQFHYPDTATGAVIQKYTTLALDGNAQNMAPTDNTDYTEGFTKRKTLLTTGSENNIHLNRFGFFDSLEEQLASNAKVTIDVRLEDDADVLFRANAAAAGRYIVTKFRLWVPIIKMNDLGIKTFIDNFLKPHRWSYLREEIVVSGPLRQGNGTLRITNAVRRPRHVFIWVLNAAKFIDQEQNMFVFNTFNIANARYFTKAQLRVQIGERYPDQQLDPSSELTRAWTYLADYVKFISNNLFGPTIDVKQFQHLYGILYFDLTRQSPELLRVSTGLDFEYSLNNTTNADYHIYALILNEEEISVETMGGKGVIKN
ncbi:hypothetical protein AWC38_SpisGene14143 [Stylophora pistillata]|uniref:Uncharacterized protein n=1 Tax=Stylophora pistillata TaxID=50429 RepID=A0A2B4RYI5_STYPI|nr:hypothetical protein AWC38_SpisGene14143 [Stylophora pistillata]